MSDTVILAALAVVSPIMFAVITRYLTRADKREDWKRQDDVADRVAAAASQAEDAAKLLVESNAEVAGAAVKAAETVNGKLDEIHTLVNNNLTTSIRESRDSTALLVVALEENIADKKSQGKKPSPSTVIAIATAKAKITELDGVLSDRAKAQKIVDEQIAAAPATAT